MLVRFIILHLMIALMFSCKNSTTSDNGLKADTSKIIREIVQPQDGLEKLQRTTEGAVMSHGVLKTLTNSDISSESFKGKTLVLNFWATWCKPCMVDTPTFQATASEFPNARFVSISIDRDYATWKTFVEDENWSGNHYWIGMDDTNPLYSFTYSNFDSGDITGVHVSLPKYVIIGADGTIKKQNIPSPGTPNFKTELSNHIL